MAEKYRFLFGADYVYRQRWYRRVVLLEKQYWLAKKLREISEIQRRSNQKTNVALIRKNEMPGRKR